MDKIYVDCFNCKGYGFIMEDNNLDPIACPECEGSGYKIFDDLSDKDKILIYDNLEKDE